MVYRYSWIAGLASVAFAYWQLSGLLFPSEGGAKWQLVVLSGFSIGLIVTWTAITYRLRSLWVVMINLGALLLAAARFSAPSESVLVFPTPAGLTILWTDLARAFDVIRHQVEPVRPITGIVIVLTALFWALGALLSWGLSKDHPFAALLPPLVVALQFATLDRRDNGLPVLVAFIVLVAGTILSVALDERDRGAGRMAGSSGRRPSHAPSLTATVLLTALVGISIVGAGLLAPRVPYDGVLAWRTPGGLGGGFFGSITINPYIEIRKGLVSQEGIPLFTAKLDLVEGMDPGDVYFRLVTMETYRDGRWSANRPQVFPLDDPPNEIPGMEYAGSTANVVADIEILNLAQGWLPAPYAVGGAIGEDEEAFLIRRSDTSLLFRGDRTYQGMQYRTLSSIPILEPEAVAGVPGGGLSPLFSTAVDKGQTAPVILPGEPRILPDEETYTELPPDTDPEIRGRAVSLTRDLITPFEKGLAIEYWFRESGGFVYDLEVTPPGHGDDVLAAWLFDDSEENVGYRRGYCEQFATSMAVMTRSIGIPTRVVLGFTPGERTGEDEVLVLDRNAHSWVELWIPEVGWVSFDPTPRRDDANPITAYGTMEDELGYDLAAYLEQVPERPRPLLGNTGGDIGGVLEGERVPPDVGFVGAGGGEATAPGRIPGWVTIVSIVAGILGLIVLSVPLVKWVRHRGRMQRLADGDITAAWEEIVVRLTDLGEEPDAAATPVELADHVDDAMTPLAAVYSRSVYGSSNVLMEPDVDAARQSMELTSDRLSTRYSTLEQLRARFRLASLRRRFR
ncbi:MAG: transglutaminaseTgpA domain-containing protein [Actinomycetota bacterium]